MKRYIGCVVVGILAIAGAPDTWGYEHYILGGEEHPWASGETVLMEVGEVLRPFRLDPSENVAVGYKERGGSAKVGWNLYAAGGLQRVAAIFDGDPSTAMEQEFQPRFAGNISYDRPLLDLGGRFPVHRIVFYPRPDRPERYIDRFRLYVNNGTDLDYLGSPIWQKIEEREENTDPVIAVEFPRQLVRYVELHPWQNKAWEIAELEVYGEGYVPEALYVSDIIDFGELASWGRIRWQGERDPEAQVLIQTRTGLDDDPNVYWRRTGKWDEVTSLSEDGALLTATDYANLPTMEQGGTTYDTENWSFWSAPYDFEEGWVGEDGSGKGVPIVSPGPRRYIQIRVDFRSTDTDGGLIEWLGIALSRPPAADAVVAEIWPLEVEPATSTPFVYSLTPTIHKNNTGFNSLEIFTGVEVDGVDYVRINDAEVDLGMYVPEILSDRLVVHFPRMGTESIGSLLEVGFRCVVLRSGTEFVGWVYDSEREEVSQRVGSGDASERYDGDELSVRTRLGGRLIRSVEVSGGVFSPNGDGMNDVWEVRFDVLTLTGDVPIEVSVYDLVGRQVREVYRELGSNGRYRAEWDGRDAYGEWAHPGIYVYRISVESDTENAVYSGAVAIAY